MLKEEYDRDEINEERGIYILDRVVSRKLVKPYTLGFKAITKDEKRLSNKFIINNVATNLVHFLTHKVKEDKDYAFRSILKGIKEIGTNDPDLHVKGMLLMSLKEYPRQSKRNAFYSWYIRSTLTGQALLQKISHRLVL